MVDDSGNITWGLRDGLYSTVLAVDGNADVVGSFAYEPFGETTATNADYPFLFTGRTRVDDDLYYYRARFYDPRVGRFISEDPIGFGGGDVNLYRYVGNGAVNFVDPTGKILPLSIAAGVGFGALTGTISGATSAYIAADGKFTEKLGAALIGGAIGGVFGGALGGLNLGNPYALAGISAAAGGIGDVLGQGLGQVFDGTPIECIDIDWTSAAVSAGLSGVGGGLAAKAAKPAGKMAELFFAGSEGVLGGNVGLVVNKVSN